VHVGVRVCFCVWGSRVHVGVRVSVRVSVSMSLCVHAGLEELLRCRVSVLLWCCTHRYCCLLVCGTCRLGGADAAPQCAVPLSQRNRRGCDG